MKWLMRGKTLQVKVARGSDKPSCKSNKVAFEQAEKEVTDLHKRISQGIQITKERICFYRWKNKSRLADVPEVRL